MDREWRRDGFVISTDPNRLDVAAIHAFLMASYWAIPRLVIYKTAGGPA